MKKHKFAKGKRIDSIAELEDALVNGSWVYWNDIPKHPSILWHMHLRTLRYAITLGILYVAQEELP